MIIKFILVIIFINFILFITYKKINSLFLIERSWLSKIKVFLHMRPNSLIMWFPSPKEYLILYKLKTEKRAVYISYKLKNALKLLPRNKEYFITTHESIKEILERHPKTITITYGPKKYIKRPVIENAILLNFNFEISQFYKIGFKKT